MDLNHLLSQHQVALHDLGASVSLEGRRWAGLRADFYAGEIRQTRDGYLWLGTFGGLARFDGSTFRILR